MPKLDQQIRLPDGRRLGFDEHGPADGRPVLYFHGAPSSRLEAGLFIDEEMLQRLNVRLVAVDRPGMGLSDFQPGRQILDWSRDVLALMGHLQLERPAVLAYSLGGSYGLACAYAIPERLSKVGIVSGPAPYSEADVWESINPGTRRYLELSHKQPWLLRTMMWSMGKAARYAPGRFLASANGLLPEVDRRVTAEAAFSQGFLAMVREALRQGSRGAAQESRLAMQEWGFSLAEIQAPVLIWHGEADQNDPVAMGRYLARTIPNSQARLYPDHGHLSLFKQYAEEILAAL